MNMKKVYIYIFIIVYHELISTPLFKNGYPLKSIYSILGTVENGIYLSLAKDLGCEDLMSMFRNITYEDMNEGISSFVDNVMNNKEKGQSLTEYVFFLFFLIIFLLILFIELFGKEIHQCMIQ